MSSVKYDIEILNAEDSRPNEFALKVLIKNTSKLKVTILTLVPIISEDVDLVEQIDAFGEENKKKFEGLCKEMSFIVEGIMLFSNSEYRKQLTETLEQMYSAISTPISVPKTSARKSLFFKNRAQHGRFTKQEINQKIIAFEKKISGVKYQITSQEDAKWALENFFGDLPDKHSQKVLFEGKLQQLYALPDIENIDPEYVTNIDPDSFYSRTYVANFGRGYLTSKIYDISFDSKYITDDGTEKKENRANVSTSINISPSPLLLTLFAAFASILGTMLKYCLDNKALSKQYWGNCWSYFQTAGIVSMIIAILFFNVYEFTEIGKKVKGGVNWRSALVIGTLAGLFGDRFLDAIRIMLGIGR